MDHLGAKVQQVLGSFKKPECRACGQTLGGRQYCCRWCGKPFCSNCSRDGSKAGESSLQSNGDPSACPRCAGDVVPAMGCTRSLSSLFVHLRAGVVKQRNGSSAGEQWSIDEARKRISDGFLKEVHGSGTLAKVISSLVGDVIRPAWDAPQHAALHWKIATSCRICHLPLGAFSNKKCQCCVCGVAVCSNNSTNCSTTELLVYLPEDDSPDSIVGPEVHICIINAVGSPSVEPKFSKYLRICKTCCSEWKAHQLASYQARTSGKGVFIAEFVGLYLDSMKPQAAAAAALAKYEQLVAALGCNGSASKPASYRSNVQVLAKSQIDLNDLLGQHIAFIMKLKALSPPAGMLLQLVKAVIQAKCVFYQESMCLYRRLRSAVEDVAPADTLQKIQAAVDLKAVECTYICVRQLGLEVLHLAEMAQKKGVSSWMKLAEHLASTEEIIKEHVIEANPVLMIAESWQNFQDNVDALIKDRMCSRRTTHTYAGLLQGVQSCGSSSSGGGSSSTAASSAELHAALLAQHCLGWLERIALELNARASHRSFCTVKESLSQVEEFIYQLLTEQHQS